MIDTVITYQLSSGFSSATLSTCTMHEVKVSKNSWDKVNKLCYSCSLNSIPLGVL